MYTEDDLRTTFDALEREAPDVDVVLAGVERLRQRRTVRRRGFGMAAAAVVVVSVAAGSILVANPDRPGEAAAPADTHAERYRVPFQVGDIPGHEVAMYTLDGRGDSGAWITTPANIAANFPEDPYSLSVFRRGGFDPATGQAGEPVEVNGRPGFYRADVPCHCGSSDVVPSIGWEYAPDSWALLENASTAGALVPPDTREVLMSMATAVHFDRTTPLTVPFRIGYLPAGLAPSPYDAMMVRPVAGQPHVDIDLEGPGGRSLRVSASAVLDQIHPVGDPSAMAVLPLTVRANLGQVTVDVSGKGYTTEELEKVAESIRPVGDVDNPATWLDADEAIALR
jgi:hypothetical protein